jgi:hypothetical protein
MSITAPLHRALDYLTGFSALELTPSAKARINIRLILEGGLPIIGPLPKHSACMSQLLIRMML